MNFELEDIELLFQRFSMVYLNDEYKVVDRKTLNILDDQELVSKVKFAYTWIKATEHERSRETVDPGEFTENDYNYAFSEDAKSVYDAIMSNSKNMMITSNTIPSIDALKSIVKNATNYKYASSIIDGIFANSNRLKSFDEWIRYSTRKPELFPVQENNQGHGRK